MLMRGGRIGSNELGEQPTLQARGSIPMELMGTIIGWILFGLVAGAIARLLHPGSDAMGWGATILLGIMGSLLGGGLAYLLRLGTRPFEPAGLIFSIIGAIILLALGWFATRPRTTI
jgi:uncharacterized membrane protein YeaQ/YmgE (transglycosylase-associated protein family)